MQLQLQLQLQESYRKATGKLFKHANMEIVSYSVSAIYVSVFIAAVVFSFYITNLDEDLVLVTVETIGIVLGLFYFRALGHQ